MVEKKESKNNEVYEIILGKLNTTISIADIHSLLAQRVAEGLSHNDGIGGYQITEMKDTSIVISDMLKLGLIEEIPGKPGIYKNLVAKINE